MSETESPSRNRVCLSAALDSEIRKLWADLTEEFCEKVFAEYAPPCRCRGNDPFRPPEQHAVEDFDHPDDVNLDTDPFDTNDPLENE